VHIGKTRADAIYPDAVADLRHSQVGGQKGRCEVWLLGDMGDAAA